ncbi:MAG: DMT family transporter [Syntrophomonadaceae bacterium]|jgi:drug/metabolite transporter (DMT)-like permease|nr:DMT family transporter [Syntrophomonadaceae bacterium]MDH7498347.1 DMT family transporter [Syntrophomonadaceae bacterium]
MTSRRDLHLRGTLLVVASALGFGTIALFAKFAFMQQADLATMLALRFSGAGLVVWSVALARRQPLRVPLSELPGFALLALLQYGIATVCFFSAIRLLDISLATMLLYTYPLMVAAGERTLTGKPLGGAKVAALALASAGLALILHSGLQHAASEAGMALALGSAVAYSAYILYGNRVSQRRPPLVSSAWVLLFAGTGYWLWLGLRGAVVWPAGAAAWGAVTGMAVIATALPLVSLFAGMQLIEASRVAIISCVEPVFTVSAAALLFHESLGASRLAGAFLVLAAILVLQTAHAESE